MCYLILITGLFLGLLRLKLKYFILLNLIIIKVIFPVLFSLF